MSHAASTSCPARSLNDVLAFCVCLLLEVMLELHVDFWIIHHVFQSGVVPSRGFTLSRFVDSQLVSVCHEEDVVKDLFTWFDPSSSQSSRSAQLGFDLLDFVKRVLGNSEVVYPVPCSLWSNMRFAVPFRLLLRAGLPRVHEGDIVSCARAGQSLTVDVVALRRPRGRSRRLPRR